MRILIKQGYVLDPSTNTEGLRDILIENNRIVKVAPTIEAQVDEEIDAAGKCVMPGFIDLHVHLREPGFEYKETIETGVRAAAKGGYTTICAMPNTRPATDNKEVVEYIVNKAKELGVIHVLPVGAITKGQFGEELCDYKSMKEAGICALSEDGKSVMETSLYSEAMYADKEIGLPVFAHCEDQSLVRCGVINQGMKAKEYGLKGITNSVEDVIAARDIFMAKEAGCRLHLCHCSTEDSVKLVKMAKEMGLLVTAEVCPHHFTLTDEDITRNHGDFKMNPPLRSPKDVEALRIGLKEGIMDVIATDHAPHGKEENDQTIDKAPFGIVGLETAFCLGVTELVNKGYLSKLQLVEKMSTNPAKVLGVNKGTLKEGSSADLVLADFEKEITIDASNFASKGKNTPFNGRKVFGQVEMTICDGKIVYQI